MKISLAITLVGYLYGAYDQTALSSLVHRHDLGRDHARTPIGEVWLYVANTKGADRGMDPVAVRCPEAQRALCWSLREGSQLQIEAQVVSGSYDVGGMAVISELHGTKVTMLPVKAKAPRSRPAGPVELALQRRVKEHCERIAELDRQSAADPGPCESLLPPRPGILFRDRAAPPIAPSDTTTRPTIRAPAAF